jgi:hypothetical protein
MVCSIPFRFFNFGTPAWPKIGLQFEDANRFLVHLSRQRFLFLIHPVRAINNRRDH